ncbi:MAG TPA: NfeD family protein, partial [Enhygromyxa sp.]|nr:NfeD family protein [Enhygromyxa sp.]
VALGLAIGVGYLLGWTAVTLIKRLSAEDTGVAATIDDYVGKSGEVLIAVGPGRLGKVRIELKGTTVDVLAESDEQTIARGEEALIDEMRGAKAAVVKLDTARPVVQA